MPRLAGSSVGCPEPGLALSMAKLGMAVGRMTTDVAEAATMPSSSTKASARLLRRIMKMLRLATSVTPIMARATTSHAHSPPCRLRDRARRRGSRSGAA